MTERWEVAEIDDTEENEKRRHWTVGVNSGFGTARIYNVRKPNKIIGYSRSEKDAKTIAAALNAMESQNAEREGAGIRIDSAHRTERLPESARLSAQAGVRAARAVLAEREADDAPHPPWLSHRRLPLSNLTPGDDEP